MTATWLRGYMVTTVWRQHGYTIRSQFAQDSWTYTLMVISIATTKGATICGWGVIYTSRGQGTKIAETERWAEVRCIEVVVVTQLNKSSWIRGGGVRPAHFPRIFPGFPVQDSTQDLIGLNRTAVIQTWKWYDIAVMMRICQHGWMAPWTRYGVPGGTSTEYQDTCTQNMEYFSTYCTVRIRMRRDA